MTSAAHLAPSRPPLLLSTSPPLLEQVQRLAAAAGCGLEVGPDPAAALPAWRAASVVLVGEDAVPAALAAAPPRRGGVHVVGAATVPDGLFRTAVALGAESVVELPRAEEWLVELLTDAGEPAHRARVLAVVGGVGGVGASVLACALAQVGARHGPTLLVDTDPLGAGADRLLGLEEHPGVRWDALEQTTGRLSSRALREAVPRREGLGVLAWRPGPAGTLQAFAAREALSAARRGHRLVVLDLARHGGVLVDELVARSDHLLVLAPASVPGAAATVRLLDRLPRAGARSLLLAPGPVTPREMARATGLEVLAEVPRQRGLAEAVDLGLGPVRGRGGALGRLAARLLDDLAPECLGLAA